MSSLNQTENIDKLRGHISTLLDDHISPNTNVAELFSNLSTFVEKLNEVEYRVLSNKDLEDFASLVNQAHHKLKSLSDQLSGKGTNITVLLEQRLELSSLEKDLAIERERREKDLAIERERREKDLAIERERREKDLAVARERREKDLAVARERREKDLAVARERREKDIAIERERLEKDLASGNLFLPIGEVVHIKAETFTLCDPKDFNREAAAAPLGNDGCYKKTLDGALDPKFNVTFDASRSKSNTTSVSGVKYNMFGNVASNAESAHLMPHAHQCSMMWFTVVPWVLDVNSTKPPKRFSLRRLVSRDTNQKKWEWNLVQKCIHGFGKNVRESHVGIKNFGTNRINLQGQKTYLDKKPCLVIVPIMKVDNAKDWHGEGYSAIVLAGNYERTEASEVYRNIGACDLNRTKNEQIVDLLANEEEVKDALELLAFAVKCIAKSSKNRTEEIAYLKNITKTGQLDDAVKNAYEQIQRASKIDIPEMKKTLQKFEKTNKVNVRKVTFSDYTDDVSEDGIQKAPDPILLLSKAASNWLKLINKLHLLPGCDIDDESDKGQHYRATLAEEWLSRGWPLPKKPQMITEISVPREEVDVGSGLDDMSE